MLEVLGTGTCARNRHAIQSGAGTNLVVALAGGAMGNVFAALFLGNSNLGLGDARAGERGAKDCWGEGGEN